MRSPLDKALVVAVALGLAIGCGGNDGTSAGEPVTDTGFPDDTGTTSVDSTPDSPSDGAPPPARRLPCVGHDALGTDLPLDVFGALECELVSLVPPGSKACPSDSEHLHLQVEANGKRYDVAVTIDSSTGGAPLAILTKDIAGGTAPPGWSDAGFDFPTMLKAPSADFTPLAKAELLARLQKELATASLVSIHGHSYTDGTGLHNVHRNGSNHDGVILIRGAGVGGTDHAVALRFSTDVF
jgi:hypothetical protein